VLKWGDKHISAFSRTAKATAMTATGLAFEPEMLKAGKNHTRILLRPLKTPLATVRNVYKA
jgi:hypothetical protein